jgi:hypothetical protein
LFGFCEDGLSTLAADIDPIYLHADIHVLRKLVDRALDDGDRRLFRACTEILGERLRDLEELERLSPLAQRYERAVP